MRQGGSLEIPAGIREVIGSRVARLTEPCRKLLSIASVLGREFGVEVLQYLSDLPGGDVYDALDEAMSERIIGDVPGAHNRLRFAHVLIRDTLYDDLTARTTDATTSRSGSGARARVRVRARATSGGDRTALRCGGS